MVQNTSELQKLISENSTDKLSFLVISALITLFFAFIASLPAAEYAAKVPSTVAMSGRNTKVRRKNRKSKTIRNFEAYYNRLNFEAQSWPYNNYHSGMQRAIGMSAVSLYKTFLWEGAYYGIIASVIGAVLGYICCIFAGAARTDTLQLVAVPVKAIVEAAVISIASCLLATAIPLCSIAKMNIVESIENVE